MQNMRELCMIIDATAREKGISGEQVAQALCLGIETALRKSFPEGAQLRVKIDQDNQTLRSWRVFELVEQIDNPEAQMLFSELEGEEVVDGFAREEFFFELSRQQVNIAKQVALQKIKSEARQKQAENLLSRESHLFMGTVKVARRSHLLVDVSGLEITIPRHNLLPRDKYKENDKIYFTLEQDKNFYVGTRTSNKYLEEVFKKEVSYVESGDVEIHSIARIPGWRAKVVVKSHKQNLDPVGACVGPKASYIKNINLFMNGENVEVIAWDENLANLVVNAMAPISVTSILVDEESKTVEVAVADENFSLAVGRGGQNAALVSRVVGWDVKVWPNEQWERRSELENESLVAMFSYGLSCDRELAQDLASSGFLSFEEVAYVGAHEFEDMDGETVAALQQNARELLANPAELARAKGIGFFMNSGFTAEDVEALNLHAVYTEHDFADLSVAELQDILPKLDSVRAGELIMQAREEEHMLES